MAAAAAATILANPVAQGIAVNLGSSAVIYATTWDFKLSGSLRKLKKQTKAAAEKREAFGFPEALDRDNFAMSPISLALAQADMAAGKVHVACVPAGLGKTSVCQIFLKCHNSFQHGIAFCPGALGSQDPADYLNSMRSFLGVGDDQPGWLACFFKALEEMDVDVVVLLDDIMSNGVTTGTSADLVFAIKTLIRGTKITVVCLMQSEEAANHLLKLNGWRSIVPVLPRADIITKRATTKQIVWATEFDMRWSETAFVRAALARKDVSSRLTETQVRTLVGNFLAALTPQDRNEIGPDDIQEMLEKTWKVSAAAPCDLDYVWEKNCSASRWFLQLW